MRRVLAATLFVLLTTLSVGAVAAGADPTPTPTLTPLAPEDPLQVVVTELLPRAPQPGDAVEVQGFIKNIGLTTVSDIQVRLKVGNRVTTRGGLHEADADRPLTTARDASDTPDRSSLKPGTSSRFDIRTSVQTLGLAGLGVYPVDVEARGDAGDGFQPLGLAPTWIPYFAGDPMQPTRVAVVWPLVDRPHQGTDTTFLDDDLATSLSKTGRLGRLLAASHAAQTRQCEGPAHFRNGTTRPAPVTPKRCEPTPVTYAVDPDLLFAASTMSAPYRVSTGDSAGDNAGDKTTAGTGQPAAQKWLGVLRQDVLRSRVVALPYADPDVTAMTRSTRDNGFRDDLSLAGVLSHTVVSDTLGTQPLDSVAWLPAGAVIPAAADALVRAGARALVLDASAYGQQDNEPVRTPSARTTLPISSVGTPVDTPVDGLVVDSGLSELMTGALAKDLGPRLAEQRFLAETAIIAAEAPGLSRTLVIAPARRGAVVVSAAAGAIRDLGRVPWLCPVSLASVAAGSERCVGKPNAASPKPQDRGPLQTARTGELSPRYLSSVSSDRTLVGDLTAVLADKPPELVAALKSRLLRAIARAESSAWRSDSEQALTYATQVHDDVQRLVDRVRVFAGQVLLTSTKGTLQVSVQNTLNIPVQIKVQFHSKTIGLLTAESGLVQIAPGHAVPVGVKAEAQRSGHFLVDAQLLDRNDHPFGRRPSATVSVQSTRYGRLALAVTIGGAAVLFIAAGIRIVRRALRSS